MTGGTEEYYMNLLADEMVLRLRAAGEGKYGTACGIIVFCAPGSQSGKRAVELTADGPRSIYPFPRQGQGGEHTAPW